MGRLENAKDNAMGKIMETAGKVTNDQELEFTGKFQSLTSEVKDKIYNAKEAVYQVGNNLIDRSKEDKMDKK